MATNFSEYLFFGGNGNGLLDFMRGEVFENGLGIGIGIEIQFQLQYANKSQLHLCQ